MDRFAVSPAAPAERPAALRALYADHPDPDPPAARALRAIDAGELDPAGLLAARDAAGAVVGAALVQALPGAIGLAWPVRAAAADAADALAAAAAGWLTGRGVKVCQAFADPADRPAMLPLTRVGFRRVTEVVHLRRPLDPDRDPAGGSAAASPLAFVPHAPAAADRFAAVLVGTYAGSLDCPELTGTRTPDEILSGFRGPWAVPPDWWLLAVDRRTGEPAGVLLFDPGMEPGVIEVSYLGLLPAARGRGWGGELIRYAAARFAADGCHALTLGVDARNDPAIRLYARHGFHETGRRDVYLAAWPGGEPSGG